MKTRIKKDSQRCELNTGEVKINYRLERRIELLKL